MSGHTGHYQSRDRKRKLRKLVKREKRLKDKKRGKDHERDKKPECLAPERQKYLHP